MKFGKRLAAEAARRWTEQYLDYKLIKRALKLDIKCKDATGQQFRAALLQELQKVSQFYLEKAEALEASLSGVPSNGAVGLAAIQRQIKELIKFVALNYLAVVKAIKKRNRHLKDAFGSLPPLHPLDILSQEVFFTSPRLAALATRAELMARGEQAAAAEQQPEAVAEEYQCPICLDTLRSPVVLTCAHRFCWGCLVAHYAAVRGRREEASHHAGSHHHHQQQGHGACHGSCDKQHKHAGAAAGGGSGSGCAAAGDGCCGGLASCGSGSSSADNEAEALVVLEKIVSASDCEEDSAFYDCPLCRKPQVLNIESLAVDPHLATFVDQLRMQLKPASPVTSASLDPPAVPATASDSDSMTISTRTSSCSSISADASVVVLEEPWSPAYLLPPQLPRHQGRMTVLLDLDGTLVSSFAPRKAPRLPRSMVTHLVGVGTSLNPSGVFVVERPGLKHFLEQLAGFAEVVVFTAGLEEYAAPIIDVLDPTGELITARIYRDGTTKTEHYQCVKDMQLVGRDLDRTVLVDDTPLAFLHQPNNGIPVLGFRGDPDDRLLHEAVLPLLQILSSATSVQPVLERRFDMLNWFKRHGYPASIWAAGSSRAVVKAASTGAPATAVEPAAVEQKKPVVKRQGVFEVTACSRAPRGTLLLFDFDRTLTDYDAGERLVGELAPELVPMLASLEMPANFIPITNDILKEMTRRGISRDQLLSTLQLMGREFPTASRGLLQWAQQQKLDVKVLSDCNSVFITYMLAGAQCADLVEEVITNPASFEACSLPVGEDAPIGLGCSTTSSTGSAMSRSSSSSSTGEHGSIASFSRDSDDSGSSRFHLNIKPKHAKGHGCGLCPENLCKGREVVRIMGQQLYDRVVYGGDGANDVCPALQLRACDVLLVRRGHGLAAYLAAAAVDASLRQVLASVYYWDSHEELAGLVQQHARKGCTAE